MSDRLALDLEELLDAERAAPAVGRLARGRVRDRLGVTLGIGMGLPPALPRAANPTPSPVAAVPGGLATAAWLKLMLMCAVGVGAGAAVYLGLRPSPPVPSVASVPSRPIASPSLAAPIVAPIPAAPQVEPAIAVAPRLRAPLVAYRVARTRHLDAEPTGDIAAERALLEQARSALSSGRGVDAIDAVARHARQFPRGQLVEERESLWVRALAATGQSGAARTHAARFRDRYPRSIFLPAVQATLDQLR